MKRNNIMTFTFRGILLCGLMVILSLSACDQSDQPKTDKQPKSQTASDAFKPFPIPPIPKGDLLDYIKPTKFKEGVFWKIEKPGTKPSFLLGTVHVDDPRVLKMLQVIAKDFKQTHTVCTEIKMDYVAKIKFTTSMVYRDGRTLRHTIGDPLYNKVVAALKKKNVPIGNINKLKPWAAWVLLVVPIPKGEVLDDRIFRNAILQRKTICGLEKVDDHIGVFTKTPLKYQIQMLEFSVDNLPMVQQQSAQLIELYVQRSLIKVYDLMRQSPIVGDKELARDYYYRLVLKRNVIMVNSMLPHLKTGGTFFAVGALHLPGELGLLQLLEKKGFTITRLY